MITARTKQQLLVFALIGLLGISYVGAHYARLDRLFFDSTYEVTAHFDQSGGIFVGSEVAYRGVQVGKVTDMRLTRSGVDVILEIDHGHDVPADTLAVVANKSAVGEQYLDLEPRRDGRPYLRDGSAIDIKDTRVPVSTTELLTNTDQLVTSLPQEDLRTAITEMGDAFAGTGPDLARIIDTSNQFIQTANDNFDVTTALIRDSNVALRTQALKGSAIRNFSRDLALFSGTLADNNDALIKLIDNGSATATQLRTFLEQNGVDLGGLINNLVTTGEVVEKHLPGVRQILVLYPYAVAEGFTIAEKGPDGYYQRSGLVLNALPPVCHAGYDPKERRSPTDRSERPMDADAHCSEPATKSNPRGSQNAPRPAANANDAGPTVAAYDPVTGRVTWSDRETTPQPGVPDQSDGLAALLFGPLYS
ncbi:MCE family protein [Nocardioides marmorisolisilvae]|uniref:MCE family protein n=1 Tax=Nocardioides marmorisolisilvae TaxID=1542737 RepID=UPI001615C11C|nr:MlaD family protein [Nocardioides marmorisolisilvae]